MLQKNSKGFTLIFILILLTLAGTVIYLVVRIKNEDKNIPPVRNLIQDSNKSIPTPTPFPFQEMTIPYLRERSFLSTLNKLEKVSENGIYTAHVTSYDSDGLKINGLLTIPDGQMPEGGWPAIIFVHGYIPPAQYQTTVNYVNYVDYFAKNGFVVFKPDLRGHGNSEGEPGGAYYSGDYVIDTLNAYSALQSSSFVNPKRIGLWGHSMAGNVTFRSFIAKPEIRAVVIWAGAVYSYEDFQIFGIDDDSYRPPPSESERAKKRQEMIRLYGEFDKDSTFWKQVVPTNYLAEVGGAIQFNHAADDEVVPVDYSRNIIKILDGTEIVHELHEYPSGGHNLTGNSFNEAMQKSLEFFKNNLN